MGSQCGVVGRLPGHQSPLSLGDSCASGVPVVRGGQTVPSQAPLCFDPGSQATDRTEGKKKGRPKAENQALRDIPVSSLRTGVGLLLGSACQVHRTAFVCPPHVHHRPSACVSRRLCASGLQWVAGAEWATFVGLLGQVQRTTAARGGLDLASVLRLEGFCSLSALWAQGGCCVWSPS